MFDQVWPVLLAVAVGWVIAASSGALFAYIVFRTKREQHETFFPARPRKPKHYPIVRDEFATDAESEPREDSGLPDVIKEMNARMASELALNGLKGERNG